MKSVILEYIHNHPETWENDMANKYIKVKEDWGYHIFNYEVGCDFSDPVVQEARGIILDLAHNKVVCWPFRKFGNWQESYADKIDWKSARVQEKVDGSLTKLWFDYAQNAWVWSTNGTINAADATASGVKNFLELIKSAVNYKDIDFSKLNKDWTYMFELVSPYNQIVIKYPVTKLYHIGTRSNSTGQELVTYVGVEQPCEYPLSTFDECKKAAEALNTSGTKHEGFVVVDGNWNRIKVKTPEYVAEHHLRNNQVFSKADAVAAIMAGEGSKEYQFALGVPSAKKVLKYYDYQLACVELEIEDAMSFARNLYEELNHDRKGVAISIKDKSYASFCFKALGNEKSANELVMQTPIKAVMKMLPDMPKD